MQRELDSQLQRSTSILESITDAFCALDQEWRFTYVNRQLRHVPVPVELVAVVQADHRVRVP